MNPVNTKPYELPPDATWLVTGCSSGIGRAIATLIASKPEQRLIATARDPTSLSYLPDDSERIVKLALDVTSSESVQAAFAAAAAHFNDTAAGFQLDVVVNNAGYSLSGDTEAATDDEAHREIETLFFGAARVTTRAIEVMRQQKSPSAGQDEAGGEERFRGGLIFNMSSLAGLAGFPGHAYYHAGKFALEGFTESVAREVHPDWNINFCILEPSAVKTKFETHSKARTAAHPAYAAPSMPARQLERYVEAGLKAGMGMEPAAVADVVYEMANRGNGNGNGNVKGGDEGEEERQCVPLRLPLGAVAWTMARAKAEASLAGLDAVKGVSGMGEEI
ncbi:oxidoreductase [Phlyctema vagabunda]|uniref:Oxidoreductase n=1 Tax=Phlyctema vagabunda TaxID=108571 RepID=A0ABR4PHC4_9HELO